MYLRLGPIRIGRPKNPGAIALESPSFDGIVKQHEQRKAHLEFRADALNKDLTEVKRHFSEQQNAINTELVLIIKRIEGLKALSAKI